MQYFFRGVSVCCLALSSTFVAHAIGSLMWLYFLPTTPEYWMLLIPRVAIERIVFALAMSLVYCFTKYLSQVKFFSVASIEQN
jgi:hypothetical protein